MEHAVPEQFWVDKSQCRYTDEQGQIKNPTQQDCAQAVSAVKAIAIAQAQGQKIYTINQSNAATALPKLPVGGTVGQEIQSAVQAGKEVTVHEKPISAHGFMGYGYTITDPETGAGAYLIEGKGNGAIIIALIGAILGILAIVLAPAVGAAALSITAIFYLLVFTIPAFMGAGVLLHGLDFLEIFTSLRMYVAFLAFTILASPVAFQVLLGSAALALIAVLVKAFKD